MLFGNTFCAGTTPALRYSRKYLEEAGVSFDDSPNWNTNHLLLDVPSFRPGLWTEKTLDTLLFSLPGDVIVWGGNLNHPALVGYHTVDLLNDEIYLQANADITADCSIPIAESALNQPWQKTQTLIIGWGRIGKSLSCKLKNLGCDVTIASRSIHHREEAASLGFHVIESPKHIHSFHLIVNTAPCHVLDSNNDDTSVYIDLASVRGIAGDAVIWARGLPGKCAPERSGKLIADTILRLSEEVF